MELFGAVNGAAFDWPWSVVHFLSGALVGSVAVFVGPRWSAKRFWTVGVGVLLAWELFEGTLRFLDTNAHDAVAPLKAVLRDFAFAPETGANVIGDVLIGSAGLALGRTLRIRR